MVIPLKELQPGRSRAGRSAVIPAASPDSLGAGPFPGHYMKDV